MKWVKRFLLLFLFVVLFTGLPGMLLGELPPPTYQDLYDEGARIWKELNELAVSSEVTLIDMQEKWPDLIKQVSDLGSKLETFEDDFNQRFEKLDQDMLKYNQDFSISLTELTALKSQYDALLFSVETLRTTYTGIENDLNTMEKKTNLGLGLSILSLLGLLAYIFFGGK